MTRTGATRTGTTRTSATPRAPSRPTRERLAAGVIAAVPVALAFFPVYLGGAALAARAAEPRRLYTAAELAVPFVPAMIVPYLSLYALFLFPPFQLEVEELRRLAHRLVAASLIGGAIFVLAPTAIGFAQRADAGPWQPLYDAVYRVDGPFNAVPSFHVLYAASILLACLEAATPGWRLAYRMTLLLLCLATLLTHRHHLLDVAAGLALARAVAGWPYRPHVPTALPARSLPG